MTAASASAISWAPVWCAARTASAGCSCTRTGMSAAPSMIPMASASFGTLTTDGSADASMAGVAPFGQRPCSSSERTCSRVPPSTGPPSRRAHTPGGRNDCSGTAARSSVTASTAGSSAAATAWRSGLRANGSFSVWNAR